MNKYAPHVYVIPEDRADAEIANGFAQHHRVDARRIQVMPEAGGWPKVRQTFIDEYVPKLHDPRVHVVMLIDFDDDVETRTARFQEAIPEEFRPRVFLVGTRNRPEMLKTALSQGFEQIGFGLADDCGAGTTQLWDHEQLQHNSAERIRLVHTVKSILFT